MEFSTRKDTFKTEVVDKVFKEALIKEGYRIREPQIQMVEDILKFIDSTKKYLVCEAEVGTGKSFAYLIPLLAKQQANFYNTSVVISTATISLQEQILKDAKYLVKLLNLDTQVILSKGSNHFLCQKRLVNYFSDNAPDWVQYWKSKSMYGDRTELSKIYPEINRYWNRINVTGCSFTKCDYYNECPYFQLRQELKEPNKFIITNHDQLIVHAQKVFNDEKPIFSPDIEYIVLDEAHGLEDKAFNALTKQFFEKEVLENLETVDRHLSRSISYSEIADSVEVLQENVTKFFTHLANHYQSEYQKSEYKHDTSRIHLPEISQSLLANLKILLDKVINAVDYYPISGRRIRENVVNAQTALENFSSFLKELIYEEKLFWLEKVNHHVNICSVPKETGDILREEFFTMDRAKFIMTSGTVTQSEDELFERYLYYLSCVGLDMVLDKKISLSEPKLSPYSYETSTMLYVDSDLPHPTYEREQYRKESIPKLIQLMKMTNGRAMILFTSKDDLKYVHGELVKYDLPWQILVQDNESSQQTVIDKFKEDEHSILLSTGIFWEGIDIKGPALSNLIIYRLPFPIPDPILEYKKEQAFSEEEFFHETLVPKMIIRLRQGIGRLIRSETDKGIVSILDPRLSSKSNNEYKEKVFNSLRFGEITEDIKEIERFAKSLFKNQKEVIL